MDGQAGLDSVIERSPWLLELRCALTCGWQRLGERGRGSARSVVMVGAPGRGGPRSPRGRRGCSGAPDIPPREACPEDQRTREGGVCRIATWCSRRLRFVGGAITAAVQQMSSWSASSPSARLTSGGPIGPEAARAAWAMSCSSERAVLGGVPGRPSGDAGGGAQALGGAGRRGSGGLGRLRGVSGQAGAPGGHPS